MTAQEELYRIKITRELVFELERELEVLSIELREMVDNGRYPLDRDNPEKSYMNGIKRGMLGGNISQIKCVINRLEHKLWLNPNPH